MTDRTSKILERSAPEILETLLQSGEFPGLREMTLGSDGEVIRNELVALVERFVPPRATRSKKKIFAKILRDTDKGVYEEPVVIRDISASGALLAVPLQTGLTARDLKEVRLKLRAPGIEALLVNARLARVSGADTDFVYAGFRFVGAPPGLEALLSDLTHAGGGAAEG